MESTFNYALRRIEYPMHLKTPSIILGFIIGIIPGFILLTLRGVYTKDLIYGLADDAQNYEALARSIVFGHDGSGRSLAEPHISTTEEDDASTEVLRGGHAESLVTDELFLAKLHMTHELDLELGQQKEQYVAKHRMPEQQAIRNESLVVETEITQRAIPVVVGDRLQSERLLRNVVRTFGKKTETAEKGTLHELELLLIPEAPLEGKGAPIVVYADYETPEQQATPCSGKIGYLPNELGITLSQAQTVRATVDDAYGVLAVTVYI